ncbi:hypothetical protein HK101_004046 [Irineochytrium annulatum]|nr:hypothetical protein HK101_004046 [Irineochytrium annulatum]
MTALRTVVVEMDDEEGYETPERQWGILEAVLCGPARSTLEHVTVVNFESVKRGALMDEMLERVGLKGRKAAAGASDEEEGKSALKRLRLRKLRREQVMAIQRFEFQPREVWKDTIVI